ncbi:KilA-N domain protein [Candidatus Methanoplasma termitum]|uniref:KilA-N domain protein n=1 Tax=Candidatus Methanoplasma termitum TaxID=1577791 RepID=A0A0A7LCI9_9ARCH|nr:KilA-N domain-containing protein [Candidatus Methanoplasma termitum]AIZ56895.1 KilA-N domain protein [Candidatus Methanoplasma termitum]
MRHLASIQKTSETKSTSEADLMNNRSKKGEYLSLIEIARYKNPTEPKAVVESWMRQQDTIEFLGMWEYLNNPNFKLDQFEEFKKEAEANAFLFSPKKWIDATGATGLMIRAGRGGGIHAHSDIALQFACWISVEFKMYMIKEFLHLKEDEHGASGWTAKSEFANIGIVMK